MYQFQLAPVPKLPPVVPSVVDEPVHIVEGNAVAEAGKVEVVLTTTEILTQVVVLHVPSALA